MIGTSQKEFWEQALMPPEATLQQVIRNLEETALQIVLVVSEDGVLLGTITDGDVRRGLLRGFDLQQRVDEIMFRSPMVAPPGLGRDVVLHLMRINRLLQLPVVDAERRVVGLHLWNEVITPASRPNLMLIMAGGFGRRLIPYTENCPKPMLTVGGKPMLEHIIERARSEGISRFALAVHYLGHMIEDYFGTGERWGVRIEYLREESPLGTAGALSLLDPEPVLPLLVTNGDVLTDIHYGDLLDFHQLHEADATMAVRQYEWQHPFGVVQTRGVNIVAIEEKPVYRTYVNAGIYVLKPEALRVLKKAEHCDMPELFERLQGQGAQTIAYPMYEPWLDVGRTDDLLRANSNRGEKEND